MSNIQFIYYISHGGARSVKCVPIKDAYTQQHLYGTIYVLQTDAKRTHGKKKKETRDIYNTQRRINELTKMAWTASNKDNNKSTKHEHEHARTHAEH